MQELLLARVERQLALREKAVRLGRTQNRGFAQGQLPAPPAGSAAQ